MKREQGGLQWIGGDGEGQKGGEWRAGGEEKKMAGKGRERYHRPTVFLGTSWYVQCDCSSFSFEAHTHTRACASAMCRLRDDL